MLIIIGFLVFGPHVILVSTIPMEFGTRKAASTATGKQISQGNYE